MVTGGVCGHTGTGLLIGRRTRQWFGALRGQLRVGANQLEPLFLGRFVNASRHRRCNLLSAGIFAEPRDDSKAGRLRRMGERMARRRGVEGLRALWLRRMRGLSFKFILAGQNHGLAAEQ